MPESTPFSLFFKAMRHRTGLTQQELAAKAGVGLRFVRDVEQGKKTVRVDRLNMVLALFGYVTGPVRIIRDTNDATQG